MLQTQTIAMKLGAIGNSGKRLKDFVDITYLSTKMSLSEMLISYENKYDVTAIHALRGLSYFDEIDFNVKIELINTRFNWSKIEKRIMAMIRQEDKIFDTLPI
jgi:uncharacterized protein YlbG (UPF0298 family)